jgi:type IX secretion system PorP/SprF family membrane protein
MKKIIALFFTIGFGTVVHAQQLPQLTQYMINNYAINPAIAGMHDYYQVNTTIRNQMVGINDAPRTTILSIYGKKNDHVGLGGVVYNDQAGPTSRLGGNMSYTYHLSLSSEVKAAFALAAGFSQLKISKNGLKVLDSADPFFQGGDIVRAVPDATFGFNTYGKNWYFGLSIPQLLSYSPDLIDRNFYDNFNEESDGKLGRHYYVLGAYKHQIDPFWSIEPSLLLKSFKASPTQFDIGVKTTYDDKLWFGGGYRTNGDILCLLGYTINERYMLGYSYDISTGDIGAASNGSHEFMLGIKFITNRESEIMKMR